MREANPRAHLNRLITDRNYLGAQLYLKEAELETDERNELMGMLAAAVVNELSAARRDDRERIAYLRSVLAWILREIPGLGSLYREQVRVASGHGDFLTEFTRGLRNLGDVASGRKSVGEGVSEAAEDARRNFEDAADRFRSGESGERFNEFLAGAERGIRSGLDQLGAFFRAMNDDLEPGGTGSSDERGPAESGAKDEPLREADRAAARASTDGDVEDAEFSPDGEAGSGESDAAQDINVERE